MKIISLCLFIEANCALFSGKCKPFPLTYIQSTCWWMQRHQLSNWKHSYAPFIRRGVPDYILTRRELFFAQEVQTESQCPPYDDTIWSLVERNPPGPQLTAAVSPQSNCFEPADCRCLLVISTPGMGTKAKPWEEGTNCFFHQSQLSAQTMKFPTQLKHLCSTICTDMKMASESKLPG